MPPLLESLRQRKLVQWGLAYLAGAWVALQVLALVADSFGWPPAAMRMITVALGLGLLPALVLAYYHGERGEQRVSAPEVLILLVLLAVQGGAVWAVGRSADGAGSPADGGVGDRRSVAVLPFASHGADAESDIFASGIHDELLTHLSRLGSLKVISRASVLSYRDTRKPLGQIATELGVGTVLQGSVQRVGERVRVRAQLVDAAADTTLWADSYDRDVRDVLGIQAEIAREIAGALHAQLSPAAETHLARVHSRSVNPRMYEVYLRGLDRAEKGDHPSAIETFREALEVDSTYAPTYAAIARSYYSLGFFGELAPGEAFGSMRQAAARAIELDRELADAYATMALFYLHDQWDWRAADQHFRRALELSPNHAQVRHDYAHYLLAVGRIQESVEWSLRAAELDPANSMLKACTGWHDFTHREYDNAMKQAMTSLMMMPSAFWPQIILGWAYEHKGMHSQAIRSMRNAVTSSGGSPFAVASLAHAHAHAGERTPARRLLDELIARSGERYVSAYDIAVVFAALGDRDQALAWLQRAYAERSAMLVNIGWDPRFDELRGDPRFRGIIERMELPDRPTPRSAGRPSGGPPVRGM